MKKDAVLIARNKRLDLAFRLGEHVANRADVLTMLDEMSEEEFGWWLARDRVVPVGHQTKCTALLTHAVLSFVSDNFDEDRSEQALMPWLKLEKVQPPVAKVHNRQARQMANMFFDRVRANGNTR